jgi:CheY-like chemotaxis protein
MNCKNCKILVADDSDDDQLLIARALDKSGAGCRIFAVSDGEKAIRYIAGVGEYEDRSKYPFPDAVLLDLKLPRRDGFEVLQWLRASGFKDLPVVAHSSSSHESDIRHAFESGANLYLCKAPNLSEVSGPLIDFLEHLPHAQRAAHADGHP